MVTFISLFLSLVTGVHPVTFAVSEPVTSIEVQLNGHSVATLRSEPWMLALDFGPRLTPHELVAIGRDRDGREVTRKTQWINMPRERASLDIFLEDHQGGHPRRARVAWQSVEGRPPTALYITFDGQPLPPVDPRSIPLPDYDTSKIHILAAELHFGSLVHRTEIPVGGAYGDAIKTELTAIPIVLSQRKLPTKEDMVGWFSKNGEPLKIAAVEQGPADVVMVQDPAPRLQERLRSLGRSLGKVVNSTGKSGIPTGLRPGDHFHLLIPTAESPNNTTVPVELFPLGPDLGQVRGGLFAPIISRFTPENPNLWDLAEQNPRIHDAVAVAGLAASTAGRPRAVVLLTSAEAEDVSRFRAEEVRRYLHELRVPLLVWSPLKWKKSLPQPWGPVQETVGAFQLSRAIDQLRQFLDRQAVVWVEGLHLPHLVELNPAAGDRIRLAGTSSEPLPELGPAPLPIQQVAATQTPPQDPDASEATERIEPAVAVAADQLAGFVDTVDVQVVNVDVVVTDRKGRLVTDLRQEDFEIYEDRKPVAISHFVGPSLPSTSPPPPQTKPEAVGGDALEPFEQEPPSPQEALHLVIFMDNARIRPLHRKLMIQTLRDFLAEDLPIESELMLITYNGTLRVRQPFTSDPGEILARLDERSRARNRSTEGDRSRRDTGEQIGQLASDLEAAARSGEAGDQLLAEATQSTLLASLEARADEENLSTRNTVQDLERLVESLGGIEGRKLLLYVGDGLSFDAFDASSAGLEKVRQAQDPSWSAKAHSSGKRGDQGISRAFRQLTDRANANRVTFYSLTPPIQDAVNTADIRDPGMDIRTTIQDTNISNTKEAVCMMSGTTGGLCQVGGTKPALLLEKTRADFGATYSLAYSPSHPGDGEFHRIEVKVKRPKLRVRHREGYVDRPAEARLRDRLSAALLFDADENPLGLEIEFEPQEFLDRGLHLVPLQVKVPINRLALLPTEDSSQRASQLKLLISTMDEHSKTTGVQEVPISFQVAADRLGGETVMLYAHRVHLTLKEGEQRIALGLWDELGRSGSFLSREITVGPPPEQGP